MHASSASLVSTGVPGLDAILRGGLPIKRIYLLQGAPGVGKTTLGLQFLLEGLRHGEGGLYVALSETEDELRAVAISHGWDLAGITLHQLSTPEELLEQQRASTIFHTAEVELNESVSKVMNLVERTKPARIVIDSLSELRLLAGDSLRYRRQILSLKQQFERAVFFTFDESLATFYSRASSTGMALDGSGSGPLVVRRVEPGELSPGAFADEVQRSVENDGTRLVVIDSLNSYLMAMPKENLLLLHMHELLTYLGKRGVLTILVVAQHGIIQGMQAPVDLTYLADTVVLFRFFETRGQVCKAISVLKKRIGGHETTIRQFDVDREGIRFGPPLSEFRGVLTGVPEYVGPEAGLSSGQR